jgi:hypothetical protein
LCGKASDFLAENLPDWQVLPSCMIWLPQVFCVSMKKIYNKAKPGMPFVPRYRSLRRFVRKVFASFIKHQVSILDVEFQKQVKHKLKSIEAMIAREIERQSKPRK